MSDEGGVISVGAETMVVVKRAAVETEYCDKNAFL